MSRDPVFKNSPSAQAFNKSPFSTTKWSTYFPIYDQLFGPYRDQEITFVEVGVQSGGSLFMWREFFGPKARIIGIDLNEQALKFKEHGFEIYIGDQASPKFWQSTLKKIGPIDLLLDDGGHRFEQQIITTEMVLPSIKDGGLIAIEDTHSSYMSEFGGPAATSFIAYAKSIIDALHQRNAVTDTTHKSEPRIHSIQFFDSLVALEINSPLCARPSRTVKNDGTDLHHGDHRYKGAFLDQLDKQSRRLNSIENPDLRTRLARWVVHCLFRREIRRDVKRQAKNTKFYFR